MTDASVRAVGECPELDVIGFAESEKPFVEYLQAGNRIAYLAASQCWITRDRKTSASTSFQTNYILPDPVCAQLTVNIIEQVANDCHDLGIYTDCNILIGNIRETEKDIEGAMQHRTHRRLNKIIATCAPRNTSAGQSLALIGTYRVARALPRLLQLRR